MRPDPPARHGRYGPCRSERRRVEGGTGHASARGRRRRRHPGDLQRRERGARWPHTPRQGGRSRRAARGDTEADAPQAGVRHAQGTLHLATACPPPLRRVDGPADERRARLPGRTGICEARRAGGQHDTTHRPRVPERSWREGERLRELVRSSAPAARAQPAAGDHGPLPQRQRLTLDRARRHLPANGDRPEGAVQGRRADRRGAGGVQQTVLPGEPRHRGGAQSVHHAARHRRSAREPGRRRGRRQRDRGAPHPQAAGVHPQGGFPAHRPRHEPAGHVRARAEGRGRSVAARRGLRQPARRELHPRLRRAIGHDGSRTPPIDIPIVTLDMDLDVSGQLKECCVAWTAQSRTDAANLSDMLVRAKYRLFTTDWALGTAVGAAGLQVRIPTGNPAQGLGTGYGEIGPDFPLSTSALDGWLDSYWDVGVDAGIGNTRWSSGDYRWALDLHAPRGEDWWTRLALAWEVLGRSEFTNLRQPSSISGPHVTSAGTVQRPFLGIDASRHDYVDTALGVRVRVVGSMVLSLGVFKALNDQGVRPSGWSPVMSVEGTF